MKQAFLALFAAIVIGGAGITVDSASAQTTKKTTTKKSSAKKTTKAKAKAKKTVKKSAKKTTKSRRGKLYLTAYGKNGSQAKAGKFGKQITLRTVKADTKKKTSSKLPIQGHTERISLCSKTYYTTKRGKSWVAAHRRARHSLVVRKWVSKGKYSAVCGKVPKKAKPTKAKPAKTKKKTTSKKKTKSS